MEQQKFNDIKEVFDLYVPRSGKALNLGGEVARAFMALDYACFNDGDMLCYDKDNLYKSYIKDTANWLQKLGDNDIHHEIAKLKTIQNYDEYSKELAVLGDMCLAYLNANPEVFTVTDFEESR